MFCANSVPWSLGVSSPAGLASPFHGLGEARGSVVPDTGVGRLELEKVDEGAEDMGVLPIREAECGV